MEGYTNLQSVETEEIQTIGEAKTLPMPNENVLINFGEDADGNPTYKGETLGGSVERPTETIELSYVNSDIDFIVDSTNKSINAVSYNVPVIPLSSEIQKIEILFNDSDYPDWINLQEMINYDPQNPYILFANKPFFNESAFMSTYFRVYFIKDFNIIAGLIESYEVNKVRITYKI